MSKFLERKTAQDLAEFLADDAPAKIGEGHNRFTDGDESDESTEDLDYRLKYGLDKNGDPLPSYAMIERSDHFAGAALDEGWNELIGDADSLGAAELGLEGLTNIENIDY